MTDAWVGLPDGTWLPMDATIRPDREEGPVIFLEPAFPELKEDDDA